jgi:hypothetical protein
VIKIDKTLLKQILNIMNYKELYNNCNMCNYYLHQPESINFDYIHVCSLNAFNLPINPVIGSCDFWAKKKELTSIKNIVITTTDHDE